MSKFWNTLTHRLQPYVPGEQPKMQRLVKLNTNEHPCGPSPKALLAIAEAADDALRLYPDPESTQLRDTLANYYSLKPEQVFVGNGSDEVLAHIFQTFFAGRGPLLMPEISYSFYPVYCGLYGVQAKQVPLAEDFSIRLEDYSEQNGGIIFANPNAPTGIAVGRDQIESLLKRNTESVVVVDEAYVDFGADTAIALIDRYPNLLVTQTLSKSRALAGLRVGFAFGDAALIEGLNRVKNSFNSYPLDRLAVAGACAAFEDEAYFQLTRQQVIGGRDKLAAELTKRGFTVLPSSANFLFCRHNADDAAPLAAKLREQGVIVRHFKKPEKIAPYLRITVGTEEQHGALLEALDGGVAG